MSMTDAAIKLNYNKAKQAANDLEEVADRLSRLANNTMDDAMQTVSTGWKGDNASSFLRKANVIQDEIADVAKEVLARATETKNAAKKIYDAEMANLKIAQQRNV